MKGYTPVFTLVFTELPLTPPMDSTKTSLEDILDRHLMKKASSTVPHVQIKGKGILANSATWEDLYIIKNRIPDALSWGQASSLAGGDVTLTFIHV